MLRNTQDGATPSAHGRMETITTSRSRDIASQLHPFDR